MKKIFTLIFALLSATSMFATDAQDLASVFKGSATVKASIITKTASGQTVTFGVNSADNTKTDVTLAQCSITATVFFKTYTITMNETTEKGFAVTKSGNSYSLDDHSFKVVLNNGTSAGNVTAKVSSSDINIVDKKATIVITVTDLPSAMTSLGVTSMTVTYNLTLDHTTGVAKVESVNANVANGKFMKNGQIVILNNGKEYNAAGQLLK